MCRNMIYDEQSAEYICLETGEVFGDRIVGIAYGNEMYPVRERNIKNKRFFDIVNLINYYADQLNLSATVREQAIEYAKKLLEMRTHIRSERIALACLYISARLINNIPSTVFCLKLRINCRSFSSTYTAIARKLGIKLNTVDASSTIVSAVNKLVRDPVMRGEIVKTALAVYNSARGLVTTARLYLIIASVIYACSMHDYSVSIEEAAHAFNVSESSISYALRRIRSLGKNIVESIAYSGINKQR
ncbi:MAG: hypothetical protein QW320_11805 [Ignisphaera sp.]